MQSYKLNNGITVVTELLPHTPAVSAGVWVRAGAVDETEKGAGISHFIEHMLFKGTGSRTYKQIAEDVEKLGGQTNAFTGKEATCFYVKCLSQHLFASLDVLSDMLTDSLFDPFEIEKEKGVVVEEIKMIEDVPDDWGSDLIQEAIFRGGSLEKRIIGTRDSVRGLSREAILEYMASRYTADNLVLAICGLFDEAVLKDKLEALFGGISGASAARKFQTDAGLYPREHISRAVEQTHLFLGAKGVPYESSEVFIYRLYAALLGGGMSSRLFTAVREEKGLAYSVYASHIPFVNDGQFVIYAGVADEKEEEAALAIREEIAKLARDGVGEEELSRAREQYKGNYIFSRESVNARMFAAGRNMLLRGRTIGEEEILAGVDAVTPSDIKKIAERFADFSRYSAVSIGKREIDLNAVLA